METVAAVCPAWGEVPLGCPRTFELYYRTLLLLLYPPGIDLDGLMAPSPLFLLDWKKASKQHTETMLFLRLLCFWQDFFSSSYHATWFLVNKAGAGVRGSVGSKLVDITVREVLVAVAWPVAYSVLWGRPGPGPGALILSTPC